MLIKNLLRIVKSYKFSLIIIAFYEIIYLLKGFKGNKFHISKNQKMTNNFPCPYYFLIKIEKTLKKNNFNTFIDLGCGSGRVIDFLKRIKNSERLKKNSIFIFVNCDKKIKTAPPPPPMPCHAILELLELFGAFGEL